jgi:antitoxin VapB
MALNIKNSEVEALIAEVAQLSGETKTEAVRRALEERRARLRLAPSAREREARLQRVLEREVWPKVTRRVLGKPVSTREIEDILGYGPDGA